MPYPHPEPLSLRQTTADPYLHRRCSNRVLSQSLWVPGSWSTQRLFEPSENLWQEWDLILNVNSPPPPTTILLGLLLCPWMWSISLLLVQCLPSYWGFSDFGRGVSPHGWSSGVQAPLLTLDMRYLLKATAPDLGCGVSPLGRSSTSHTPLAAPADHINSLLIIYFANIFSYSVGCLFILLIVSFAV